MSEPGRKITPEERHRRSRETLQEQLIRNRAEIAKRLEQNRKLSWAIRLHDECEANGVLVSDQGDIDFALGADK